MRAETSPMAVASKELKQLEKGEYMKTIAMRMFGKWDLGPEPIVNPEVNIFMCFVDDL